MVDIIEKNDKHYFKISCPHCGCIIEIECGNDNEPIIHSITCDECDGIL